MAASLAPVGRRGDRALHDALELHGYAMNGGLDHGIEIMGVGVERAAAGWEYFGRRDVAEVLREALRTLADMPADPEARQRFFIDGWTDAQAEEIESLAHRYASDDGIEQAFLRHLSECPEDFAPVDGPL